MAPRKAIPGILYVTMQPKDGLSDAQFHDWYNNEHGPNRLRLSFCHNGFRYRANDLGGQKGSQEKPEFMAIYDIEDMDTLTKEVYTRLRKEPVQSQRERDTMKQIYVDRRFYDFVGEEWTRDSFKKLEDVSNASERNVMIAVFFTVKEGQGNEEELAKWYREEHVGLLQKVPGWRRTRRFVTSHLDLQDGRTKEFLALHEYAPQNGLGGEEFVKATTTPWTEKITKEVLKSKKRRVYDLFYTFGPAPRDLESLSKPEAVEAESTDGRTKTFPISSPRAGPGSGSGTRCPAIESFITTSDGVNLPYRLEGNPDPNAPLLVLANSILVDFDIWKDFIPEFQTFTGGKYRILRFNARGRTALPGSAKQPVTVDMLTSDVITILDALRVQKASIVGVSLGGATALNAGLSYPDRISSFVACDTNSFAPPSNPKAWGERIEVAEKEGARATISTNGEEAIVGGELAELTVRRWFTKESYERPELLERIENVKQMVRTNSLSGFKDSVKALYAYDFREKMGGFQGKGAFLVGSGDGVLPKTMQGMAESLGSGAELKVIDGAGHLPMVERPKEVAEFVAKFLEG